MTNSGKVRTSHPTQLSVLDAKTRSLHVIWSHTLARDKEKPGFLGKRAPRNDYVLGRELYKILCFFSAYLLNE
ncbi:hypothetical protein Osc7112_2081 [Oscillatoria nigro-viridis PCC 7112]|uniref:Uncharacterized protein n=1 Tax=Phormidium nigroviride PCC 7112 TaxID=179408 RepID=K9VH65_9CYAN|nr:hypothetical protein Osc7112_2081 [Oscillatoria nigro-viridis PCC 7112]